MDAGIRENLNTKHNVGTTCGRTQSAGRQWLTLYASSWTPIMCFLNSSLSWIPDSALKKLSVSGSSTNKLSLGGRARSIASSSLSSLMIVDLLTLWGLGLTENSEASFIGVRAPAFRAKFSDQARKSAAFRPNGTYHNLSSHQLGDVYVNW